VKNIGDLALLDPWRLWRPGGRISFFSTLLGSAVLLCGAALALSWATPCCNPNPPGTPSPLEAGPSTAAPQNHRPSGATCPASRGAGSLATGCAPDSGAAGACVTDTDCAAGQNGRCLPTPGVACVPECSYDVCRTDADCASGGPCVCRASSTDSTPNVCVPGNCLVDSDCGPSGFCSPSGLPGACGIGYYCHTPKDTCIDNADCASNEGCSFDTHLLAWACAMTCTRP
jgi:hypothetical protein